MKAQLERLRTRKVLTEHPQVGTGLGMQGTAMGASSSGSVLTRTQAGDEGLCALGGVKAT